MLTATTATATSLSTGPLSLDSGASNLSDPRNSESKLRTILRDQSRREEHHQHQPHQQTLATSSTSTTSLHRQGSGSKYLTSSSSASNLSPASNGYFASSTASPPSKRDLPLPNSGSTHIVDMYSSSQTSLSSHLQRERSLRQPYTDNLGVTQEVAPASSKLSRSQSTAGLTNGLDLKVVILGAQGVGKTSLVHRYTSGQFSASAVPSTIGASFLTKKLIIDGVKVRLQLWDTAGQERFRSMAPMYYRGSHAAVIVYDITNPSSFEDVKTWIDELRKNVHSDLVIHIVGSKADLAPHSRKVDLDDAREEVLSWTTPQQIQPSLQSAPSVRSRSAFGALRGMGTTTTPNATMVPSTSQNIPPPSPSTMGNSRLGGFGGLTSLGSKHSRLGLSPSSKEGEEDGVDADANSSPSTSSSNGGGGGVLNTERSKQEEWDFVEVSEVSSKDNEGIEDVFIGIATRLVERKEEMEALAKSRLDRNSVFLGQGEEADVQVARQQQSASWCCNT